MIDRRDWTPLRIALFIALVVLCGTTRFIDLGAKPIMHDESLFAYYTEFHLHRSWNYQYQPILHGPAHLWYQALIFHLFGASDYTLRFGIAILGFFGIFWIWSLRPWLGRRGVFAAMALYAVSPCLMFYQRFFREDGLFLFITLWLFASIMHWWRTRKHAWAVSTVLAAVMLFCNKESCLFIYCAFGTYFLLWILHDWTKGIIDNGQLGNATATLHDAFRPAMIIGLLSTIIFISITALLVLVIEGIHYDTDVVQAIGRDFALRDVNSIMLALGRNEPVEGIGALGSPWFWRFFYLLLAVGSVALASITYYSIALHWGARQLVLSIWRMLYASRYHLLGAIAVGFAIYMILFTTFFKYPKGPFQIYHETLAYWMGQNAQHRIHGPFHMHLVNMLVYQTPEVLLVLAVWFYSAFRTAWRKIHAVALLLVAFAFAAFHLMIFRGLDSAPMNYFLILAVWTAILAFVLLVKPELGRVFFPSALLLFFLFSFLYFHGNGWNAFAEGIVRRGDRILEATGRQCLDERISLTSGFHLFLIAFFIIMGTVLTWDELEKNRRFRGLLIWWLVIMIGACSYAREKVPWVGIHIAVPLVFLAAVYAEALAGRIRRRAARHVLLGLLLVGLLWNFKAAINLCFVHPGDVRERLTYAETPIELKRHAQMIQRYADVATTRDDYITLPQEPGAPIISGKEWEVHYNRPQHLREVRVLVANSEVVWPMRWYLRDIEWTESITPEQAAIEEYPFMFLARDDIENFPAITENYHLIHGRARMHWTPQFVDWEALVGIWRAAVPLHNQVRQGTLNQTAKSKREWRQLKDYLLHRHIPEEQYMGLPTVEYYFAIRKDLPPGF